MREWKRRPPAWRNALWGAALLAASWSASGRVLHVDGSSGSDSHDGLSPASALQTIQAAADKVQAGDEVIIHPGVYYEKVTLRGAKGSAEKPIVFRADRIEKNRVVLTGADAAIRAKKAQWKTVDASIGLYEIPYAGPRPSRLLYGGVDLYPYAELEGLRTFTITSPEGSPGPRHGYYHDVANRKLYVRLHASGRYGPSDPNQQIMAVSPKRGFCFTISGKGPAHVII